MLENVELLCRLILAGVLLVSAIGKLSDPPATGEAVRAFGVPARHSTVAALLLPLTELLISVLLVPARTARAGAAAALVLLGLFAAAVLVSLRRGRRFECRCFGRLGTGEISGWTVVRNAGLMVLAGTTALASPPPLLSSEQTRPPAELLLLLVSAAAGVVLIVLADAVRARLTSRETGSDADLPVGPYEGELTARGRAADFSLSTITGPTVTLQDLVDDHRPLLLTFLSPGCGPCKRLRPVIARWREMFEGQVAVAVVATGTVAANRASFGGSGVPVLVDADRAVAALYDVTARPAAVLVAPDFTRLGAVARGEHEVRLLLGAALELAGRRGGAPTGADALTLASVVGPRDSTTVTVDSSGDAGQKTVVVTDEVTGLSASLDPVAGLVWNCLDGRTPLAEIVRDLADAFGAPADVVADDVLRLVRRVGALGLLDGVAADRTGSRPDAPAHSDPVPA